MTDEQVEKLVEVGREWEKALWALVAAVGRCAVAFEGMAKATETETQERRVLSEKRRQAGLLGAKASQASTAKGADGKFIPSHHQADEPGKNRAKTGQNPEGSTGQTPGKNRANAGQKPGKQEGKSVATWAAYREAYVKRYSVEPRRNQEVNRILCQVVDLVGAEDAPKVAAFYLTHNDQWLIKAKHPVVLLRRDWQKYLNEMQTGNRTTTSGARDEERASEISDSFRRFEKRDEERKERGLSDEEVVF